jgi:hypothetical protein
MRTDKRPFAILGGCAHPPFFKLAMFALMLHITYTATKLIGSAHLI